MHYLISFIGGAVALFLTANIVPGVSYTDFTALLVATIVIGIVNTFIRPILKLVTLPITIITFGIFALVINAATFWFAAWLVPGFEVSGIVPAFIGALVLSIVSTIIGFYTKENGGRSNKNKSSSHDSSQIPPPPEE